MTILLHRAIKIGDNVVAIRAIYAIKCIFPSANLIVATNNIGANLYANLPFIDTLLNLDTNPSAIQGISDIDYFIITHRTTQNLAFAKSTSAKHIITRAHLRSLLSPRFISDFNFTTKLRPESANLLRLVRLIDKRAFDSKIKEIDFSGAKLRFIKKNSDFVEAFLAQNANGGGQFDNKNPKNRALIGVNIFGSGGVGYLSVDLWREIVESLANEFSDYDFTLLCPPNAHLEPFSVPNVRIFVNNSDLLNLVAMIARCNALISVDTGSVHIADNLQVPTLGIYTRKMIKRWRGGTYGGRFVHFLMPLHNRDYGKENDEKQKLLVFLKTEIAKMPTATKKGGDD